MVLLSASVKRVGVSFFLSIFQTGKTNPSKTRKENNIILKEEKKTYLGAYIAQQRPNQTVADCQDRCRLSRHFAHCRDSCTLSIQLHTVNTVADGSD